MLIVAGADYKATPLELREKLAFNDEQTDGILHKILLNENINGCIILSTCNRSEIYISSNEIVAPDKLLLKYAGINDFDGKIYTYRDEDAIYHLMRTACGLNSAIRGESQIITQISHSVSLSRQANCCDSLLDVLFRNAVAAGKRAASYTKYDKSRISAAYKAVEKLAELENLKDKKCLVIGNGKTGVLCARLLREKGAEVTITLRRYKHGENIVPTGCGCIEYTDRIKAIKECDILISATKSPHYTITKAMTEYVSLPRYMVDLAVPRDIDPAIYNNTNINHFNIDDFVCCDDTVSEDVYHIIEDSVEQYISWLNYRASLAEIESIKETIARHISKATGFDNNVVEAVTKKTADMIFGGMKRAVTPETIEECGSKIRSRARI